MRLRLVRQWLVPSLFVSLVPVTLAAAYSTASLRSITAPLLGPPVVVMSRYALEPGADGLGGTWIGDGGRLRVRTEGRYWIGFRARSQRKTRFMTLASPSSPPGGVLIGSRASVAIAGPFDVPAGADIELRVTPAAERASRRDKRTVSVFVSMVRLAKSPIVALPGEGFYASELEVDGAEFNWLGDRGRIDIRSASPHIRWAWLLFELGSVDFPRDVAFSGGGSTHVVSAPRRGAVRAMRVGPFPLTAGQGTVDVLSVDPPRSYGSDTRKLSVRLGALQADAMSARAP